MSHDTLEGWTLLQRPAYRIAYPSDWEFYEGKQMSLEFVLLAPNADKSDNSNEEEGFQANINLLIQQIPAEMPLTLDQYAAISEQQILARYDNPEQRILHRRRRSQHGLEYHWLIYSGDADDGTMFEQCYFLHGAQAFVLTLACLKTEYPQHKMITAQMFEQFQLNASE